MVVTPNLGLRKPQYNEFADIEDLNYNADIIDTNLGNTDSLLQNHLNKIASNSELGHVKTGTGLKISNDGTLSSSYIYDESKTLDSLPSDFEVGETITPVTTAASGDMQIAVNNVFYGIMGYTLSSQVVFRYVLRTTKRSNAGSSQEITVFGNTAGTLQEVAKITRISSTTTGNPWLQWKVSMNILVINTNPEGSLTGMRGFLALDVVQGKLYRKLTGINSSGISTGWETIDASTLQELRDHENNSNIHVTTSEKTNWNGKVNKSGDTMTGNLNINKGIPTLSLIPSVDNPTPNKGFQLLYNARGENDFGVHLTKDGDIFMLVESANSVQFRDTNDQLFSVQDLKSSVSNGKNNLKTAILAKGGTVSDPTNPPSFDSLVSGVESISTGNYSTGSTAVRTLQPLEYFEFNITGLNFTPTTIIVDAVGEVGVRNYFHTGTTYGSSINISSPIPKPGGFTFIITNIRQTPLQLTSTWQAFA